MGVMMTEVEVELDGELDEVVKLSQEQNSQVQLVPPVQDKEKKEQHSRRSIICSLSPKAKAYKNVIGAGLSFNLILSSVLALASLQSSLNDEQGLGLATLVIGSTAILISSIFTSSFIRALGTKYSSVVAYTMSFIYILSNFYPTWYTLVPGALCYGISLGPVFASVNIHATVTAMKYAPALNEDPDHLIAFFNGIVTMFFKLGYLPGNLATTIVLFSERSRLDEEIVDSFLGSVCNNTEVQNLDETYVYILLSSFLVIAIISISILCIFVDNPGVNLKFQSCCEAATVYVKDPVVATLKMFINWKILMLLPATVLSSLITSSTLGILSKVYVSDCIGVHWVGLFSLTYGTCSGVSAIVTGRLVKYIPQFIMVYVASTVMLGVLLFLLFWEREPSYLLVFLPIVILGSCEGVWFNIPPIHVGLLFPQQKEPAYAAIRMGFALGYIIGFLVPLFATFSTNLWIEVGLLLISLSTFSLLYFKTQTKEQMFPCCYRKIIQKSNE